MDGAAPRLRRHDTFRDRGKAKRLPSDHDSAVFGSTIYPTTRAYAEEEPNVLKDGFNSRKIGQKIVKGRWKGLHIYTLTLEERHTCPRTCANWHDCYGNNMHLAQRFQPGHELTEALGVQLLDLEKKHREGFAVRLHVLGDFYSENYVIFWARMLELIPGLHCFGFTAHKPGSDVGWRIAKMNELWRDRFAIRFSGVDTEVVDTAGDATGIVCPAQINKTDCCGTCALCWGSTRKISFLRH